MVPTSTWSNSASWRTRSPSHDPGTARSSVVGGRAPIGTMSLIRPRRSSVFLCVFRRLRPVRSCLTPQRATTVTVRPGSCFQSIGSDPLRSIAFSVGQDYAGRLEIPPAGPETLGPRRRSIRWGLSRRGRSNHLEPFTAFFTHSPSQKTSLRISFKKSLRSGWLAHLSYEGRTSSARSGAQRRLDWVRPAEESQLSYLGWGRSCES